MLCLSLVVLLLQWTVVGGQLGGAGGAGSGIYACEGDMLQFACNMGVILVKSATYGRPVGHSFRCGEAQDLLRKCDVDVTQYLKYRCDGHPMCEIYVDVATFMTEICPDIRKFVDVVYECVQPHQLETVASCQKKCMPGASPFTTNNVHDVNRYSGVPAATQTGYSAPQPAPQPSPAAPAKTPAPAPSHGALPYSAPNVSRNFAATLASIQAQAQRAVAMIQSAHQQAAASSSSRSAAPASYSGMSATSGTSHSATSGTGQSDSSRTALLARMQAVLDALRARKAAQQAQQAQAQG